MVADMKKSDIKCEQFGFFCQRGPACGTAAMPMEQVASVVSVGEIEDIANLCVLVWQGLERAVRENSDMDRIEI